jgi:hypothetical protein
VNNRATIEDISETAAPATAEYSEIAALAYELWMDRGCPIGSPEEDWFQAEKELSVTRAAAA